MRWLGRVRYRDAHALQQAILAGPGDDYLLLMEHMPVYTLGVRAEMADVLVPPSSVGAEMVRADRGGLVTYHGPGQLVGYPLVGVPVRPGATPGHVRAVEEVVIRALGDLGLAGAGRLADHPGVWVEPDGPFPRKICAVGTRVTRGRSMHGFALNVDTDLDMFAHIVPCGISDKAVTSLAAEGIEASMPEVVDAIVVRATERWAPAGTMERQDVAHRSAAPPAANVPPVAPTGAPPTGAPLAVDARKPGWLRVKAQMGTNYRAMQRTMRSLDLVTVCEEAGCPNIFECWADGTATFMINGSRCTRACGFCLVDSGRPLAADPGEPERVARAVARLGLDHAVVTAVA
ncbi:MAG: lipoyl synthase, partial [Acidimicrobiales bacterium]